MIRHHQLHPVRDQDFWIGQPMLFEKGKLFHKIGNIKSHARANDIDGVGIKDAARHLV